MNYFRVASFLITSILFTSCAPRLINGTESLVSAVSQVNWVYVLESGKNDLRPFSFNSSSGQMTQASIVPNISMGPSMVRNSVGECVASSGGIFTNGQSLAIDPSRKWAYLLGGGDLADNGNVVSEFSIDPSTCQLMPLSPPTIATGAAPSAIAIDPSGQWVYVANDDSNSPSISQYSLDSSTGQLTSLSPSLVTVGSPIFLFSIHPSGNWLYALSRENSSILEYSINVSSGQLNPLGTSSVFQPYNPTAMAVSPNGKWLYSVNDYNNTGIGTTTLSEYSIQPNGELAALSPNTVTTNNGGGALAIDPTSSWVYVTDAATNTVLQYFIDPSTGQLSLLSPSSVYTNDGAWGITVDPSGSWVYVTGNSTTSVYSLSPSTGQLSFQNPPLPLGSPPVVSAGNQAVSVVMDPSKKWAYVVNRADNAVTEYSINYPSQQLNLLSPSMIQTGSEPQSILFSVDGKWAYVVNHGSNTVSEYELNSSTGQLKALSPSTVATGSGPQSIAIDPTGKWVYVVNQNDNTVSEYFLNSLTGQLNALSTSTVATGVGPKAITIHSSGQWAYVVNHDDSTVSQYSLNSSNGQLTPLSVATFYTELEPQSLTFDPSGKWAYVPANGGFPTAGYDYPSVILEYLLDPFSGQLSSISEYETFIPSGGPISLVFDPSGQWAYSINSGSNSVNRFIFNPSTGTLTPSSTLYTGPSPTGILFLPASQLILNSS